jgi:putative spermidine/putrescine transport system substrate-binding protein
MNFCVKNWSVGAAVVGAALAVAAGGAFAQGRPLSVVSWGGAYQDAQKEVYFKPFMEKTGVKMVDESWDGGIGVLRAKMQGGANNWDIVQVESEELLLGCEEGLFEKLDWAKLGGRDKYLKDAVSDCGVGSIVYSFVLAYDGDKIKGDAPKNWADFWNVQKWPGKRALRKGPKTTLEVALLADGVAPGDVYKTLATPAGVDRAFNKLTQLKPHLIWWEKGSQPPQMLAAGEAVMVDAYNGRIDAANTKEKKNFKIVWTNNLYTIDSWVVMKGSPNKADADKFLAFVNDPAYQKNLPTKIAYGVTTNAAIAMIDPKVHANLPTAPDNFKGSLYISDKFWLENLDKLNQRFNAWLAK